MNKNQIQQGDVTLVKIDKLPQGQIKTLSRGKCVLAEGEHTGHSHTIEGDEAELIEIGEKILLKLEKSAILKHQEHKPITLDPGIWEVGKINTIDHLTGMVSKVRD